MTTKAVQARALTAKDRELLARWREMERRFARRTPAPAPPAGRDPDRISIAPGEVRVIDGTMWGVCAGCNRLIRFGLFGGLHLCR